MTHEVSALIIQLASLLQRFQFC